MKSIKHLIFITLFLYIILSCNQVDIDAVSEQIPSGKSETPIIGEQGEYILEPQRFVKKKGNPAVYEILLNTEEIDCFSEPFYLNIENGKGKEAVSSAIIKLENEIIFKQSDFNKKVRKKFYRKNCSKDYNKISRVNIVDSSVLSIILHGKPGSYITVSIEGTYVGCGWEYNYYTPNEGSSVATSFIKTLDGGFIFTGDNHFLVKLDNDGLVEWSNILDNGWSTSDIFQTTDGGYVITGSNGTMKINNQGNSIVWQTDTPGHKVIQCSDQNFLLVYFNDQNVVKLGMDGEILWEKVFNDNRWWILIEDKSVPGEFIISGEELADYDSKLSVMRMNSCGDIIWNNSYANTGGVGEKPYAICQDEANGFLVVGLYFRIHYISYDGTLNWSKTAYPFTLGSANAVTKSDLGFLIGGMIYNDEIGVPEGWVCEITSSGEIINDQSFGGDRSENNIIGIATTNDNYIVFGGDQWIDDLGPQYWAKKFRFEN